jgi:capsular exopolysaccharide synthesis family protein
MAMNNASNGFTMKFRSPLTVLDLQAPVGKGIILERPVSEDRLDGTDRALPAAKSDSASEAFPFDAVTPPVADDSVFSGGSTESAGSTSRNYAGRATAVCFADPSTERHAFASEQYRIIRTKLAQTLKRPFRVAITSPSIGDGKTFTAVNLAAAMALRERGKTLLIDADLRRGSVHQMLGVDRAPGLSDVLRQRIGLSDALFTIDGLAGLTILAAGSAEKIPTELLDSDQWRSLVVGLSERFTNIVIDGSPIGLVADHDLISTVCQAVILVVRPDHSDRTLTLAAIEKLRPKLAGVVINAGDSWTLGRRRRDQTYYYARPEAHGGAPK